MLASNTTSASSSLSISWSNSHFPNYYYCFSYKLHRYRRLKTHWVLISRLITRESFSFVRRTVSLCEILQGRLILAHILSKNYLKTKKFSLRKSLCAFIRNFLVKHFIYIYIWALVSLTLLNRSQIGKKIYVLYLTKKTHILVLKLFSNPPK